MALSPVPDRVAGIYQPEHRSYIETYLAGYAADADALRAQCEAAFTFRALACSTGPLPSCLPSERARASPAIYGQGETRSRWRPNTTRSPPIKV